jgi:hypothetical protein
VFRKPEWADIVERKVFEHRERGEYLVHRYVINCPTTCTSF